MVFNTKSHERFVRDFNRKREDANEYELLSEYIAATAPIEVRHHACGTTFEATPTLLLRKKRPQKCPQCYQKYVRINEEKIEEEIAELGKGAYTLLKDEKMKSGARLLTLRHEECGHTFTVYRHNVKRQGLSCPGCRKKSQSAGRQ